MKGGAHSQRRRFSLQALCVVHSPTSEEETSGKFGETDALSSLLPVHRQSRRRLPSPTFKKTVECAEDISLAAPAPTKSHYKAVVMGSARVGKTSLISQFMCTGFNGRYRPTVEDMHTVELDCNGLDLRLDILDTGGSYAFPAMRALAIKGADGFLLVCSADDPSSLEEVEHVRSQILEVKGKSFVPIVVVLNKTDLMANVDVNGGQSTQSSAKVPAANGSAAATKTVDRFLCQEMVESLVTCDWDHGFVPASAKDNVNIVQVFQELFIQAKSRIALSPAVRKRRQSLPARVLMANSAQLSQLSHLHNLSLQNGRDAASASNSVRSATAPTSVKRNSCTVS